MKLFEKKDNTNLYQDVKYLVMPIEGDNLMSRKWQKNGLKGISVPDTKKNSN